MKYLLWRTIIKENFTVQFTHQKVWTSMWLRPRNQETEHWKGGKALSTQWTTTRQTPSNQTTCLFQNLSALHLWIPKKARKEVDFHLRGELVKIILKLQFSVFQCFGHHFQSKSENIEVAQGLEWVKNNLHLWACHILNNLAQTESACTFNEFFDYQHFVKKTFRFILGLFEYRKKLENKTRS